MDKDLVIALQGILKDRAQVSGRELSKEQIGRIIVDLDAEINRNLGKIMRGKLADCGSFGCPNSYSCDWF